MANDKERVCTDNKDNIIKNPFLTLTFASILEQQGCYDEAKKVYEAILLKEPAKQDIILRRLERLNRLIRR